MQVYFLSYLFTLAIGLFLHDQKQNTAKKNVYSVHLIDTNKKTMCAIQTLKFMSNVYIYTFL